MLRERAGVLSAGQWMPGDTRGQHISSHSPQAGRGAPMFWFLGDQFEGAKPVDVPKGREERVSARCPCAPPCSPSLLNIQVHGHVNAH